LDALGAPEQVCHVWCDACELFEEDLCNARHTVLFGASMCMFVHI
jgi:hypothetical protein